MTLSDNALVVLKKRGYLLKKSITRLRPDDHRDYGEAKWESPDEMFRRVARLIASADQKYPLDRGEVKKTEEEFYRATANLEYLSGSVLLNAGRKRKQFSACYVLPLTDSLEDIYDQLRNAALIARTGGGIGIPLTNLRPRGSHVTSTGGISSGAVSFLRLFNYSAATISEASVRRPAMMGVLRVDHPDVVEFIMAKEDPSTLYHFNISVGATNDFMDRVKRGHGKIHLFHPNDGQTERDMDVMELWNLIATQAWKVGDPGLVFLDQMNRDCPTLKLGMYQATNPCGEQPLIPYESCNLGHVNLGRFVKEGTSKKEIDWKRLGEVVRLGVHFQDNVIDLCDYPIEKLRDMAYMTRKIGIGAMGWADMLVKLGIRYDSKEALKLAEKVSKFIQETARDASIELAKRRGSFPAFEESTWKKRNFSYMRNSTVNTIAPTGTISMIAGCSSGIEPLFALVYRKENILELGKTSLLEVNKDFQEQIASLLSRYLDKDKKQDNKHNKITMQSVLDEASKTGSISGLKELKSSFRDIFRVSMEIPFEWHIKMQAAWQKYTDSAVSKTINLPNSATVEDIKKAYLLAYELGCKGITVYRDGCREEQVLNVGGSQRRIKVFDLFESEDFVESERPEGLRRSSRGLSPEGLEWDEGRGLKENECPECHGDLLAESGCYTCVKCGWSKCSV